MKQNTIGEKITPILVEIEGVLLDNAIDVGTKTNFPIEGFRAGIYIFSAVMLDKMFELQDSLNMSIEDREVMATNFGNEIRDVVKKYTNIDSHDLYK